jgi:hypothetical protein
MDNSVLYSQSTKAAIVFAGFMAQRRFVRQPTLAINLAEYQSDIVTRLPRAILSTSHVRCLALPLGDRSVVPFLGHVPTSTAKEFS